MGKIRVEVNFSVEEHFSNEQIKEDEQPQLPQFLMCSENKTFDIDFEGTLDTNQSVMDFIRKSEVLQSELRALVKSEFDFVSYFRNACDILDLDIGNVTENKEGVFSHGLAISSVAREFNGDELRFMCNVCDAKSVNS